MKQRQLNLIILRTVTLQKKSNREEEERAEKVNQGNKGNQDPQSNFQGNEEPPWRNEDEERGMINEEPPSPVNMHQIKTDPSSSSSSSLPPVEEEEKV